MADEVVTQTPEPAADPAAATPQPVTLADDALIPLKIDGKDVQVPWSEARQGFQFHRTFTQKSQALAQEREKFETERQAIAAEKERFQQEMSQLKAVMQDPQALAALYMTIAQRQNKPQAPQPLTAEALPQIQQSLQQNLQSKFDEFQQKLARESAAQRFEEQFFSHARGLISKHPTLAAIDDLDSIVERQVIRMKPTSIDEAKQMASTILESMVQRQTQALQERDKAALLASKQAANGIEPRGGQAPLAKPTWKTPAERDSAMIALLEQLQPAN